MDSILSSFLLPLINQTCQHTHHFPSHVNQYGQYSRPGCRPHSHRTNTRTTTNRVTAGNGRHRAVGKRESRSKGRCIPVLHHGGRMDFLLPRVGTHRLPPCAIRRRQRPTDPSARPHDRRSSVPRRYGQSKKATLHTGATSPLPFPHYDTSPRSPLRNRRPRR